LLCAIALPIELPMANLPLAIITVKNRSPGQALPQEEIASDMVR